MNSVLSAGSFLYQRVYAVVEMYKTRPALMQPTATGLLALFGIFFLEFDITLFEMFLIVATAVATETVASYLRLGKVPAVRSALSAAFGLALFFRATHWYIYVAVAVVAILSKYVIRNSRGHLFNPSNFAIVAFVFLFPSNATIQFIGWGSNWVLYLAIAAAILAIVYWATKTSDMTFSFLGSYAALFMLVGSFFPQLVVPHHYGLLSPLLLIFAAFMLTDPQTAPAGRWPRILFGISISVLYFTLELIGVRYALFLALALVLVVNALSALVVRTAKIERLSTLPNAPAVLLLILVFLGVGTHALIERSAPAPLMQTAKSRTAGQPVVPPSLNFLLFGIQSSNLFACTTGAYLNPSMEAGVSLTSSTYGSAWGDIDGDGYDDLAVSNVGQPTVLYRNNRDGTFTEITAAAGLSGLSTASISFVDYDNDGDVDLFGIISEDPGAEVSMPVRVFKNDGAGSFSDVTKMVGLDTLAWRSYDSGGLSFADYNNDGLLDMTAVSAGEWMRFDVASLAFSRALQDPLYSPQSVRACGREAVQKMLPALAEISDPKARDMFARALAEDDVCGLSFIYVGLFSGESTARTDPSLYSYTVFLPGSVHVFKNTGSRFVEQTSVSTKVSNVLAEHPVGYLQEAKMQQGTLSGRFFQPISFDYNRDGRQDLFIATDLGSSILLENRGNFRFEDRTEAAGLGYSATGMGVDVGDVNADGWPDIFVTNVLDDYLYANNGDGTFSRPAKGISPQGIGWGVSLLDYDLDGNQDVFIANGDLIRLRNLPLTTLNTAYFRADRLYSNLAGGRRDTTWQDFCSDFESGKALAVSDYDNDGDPDVFVGNLNPTGTGYIGSINFTTLQDKGNVLYKNSATEKAGTHYLRIKLQGTVSNRMGVGSRVEVTGQGGMQTKFVLAGNSYYSQNSMTQLFGLGTSTEPVEVVVRWPSGKVSRLSEVAPNQTIMVVEPR